MRVRLRRYSSWSVRIVQSMAHHHYKKHWESSNECRATGSSRCCLRCRGLAQIGSRCRKRSRPHRVGMADRDGDLSARCHGRAAAPSGGLSSAGRGIFPRSQRASDVEGVVDGSHERTRDIEACKIARCAAWAVGKASGLMCASGSVRLRVDVGQDHCRELVVSPVEMMPARQCHRRHAVRSEHWTE